MSSPVFSYEMNQHLQKGIISALESIQGMLVLGKQLQLDAKMLETDRAELKNKLDQARDAARTRHLMAVNYTFDRTLPILRAALEVRKIDWDRAIEAIEAGEESLGDIKHRKCFPQYFKDQIETQKKVIDEFCAKQLSNVTDEQLNDTLDLWGVKRKPWQPYI